MFWRHGFQGGSVSTLAEAMGVRNPPSLCAAFGSKEQLFQEALELYLATVGGKAWQAFERAPRLAEAIRFLLVDTVKLLGRADGPRGCLLVLGDMGMVPSGMIHEALRRRRGLKRKTLAARLHRAISDGELPPDTDGKAMAASVFMFMSGISIETADGVSEALLLKSVDEFMARRPLAVDSSSRTKSWRPFVKKKSALIGTVEAWTTRGRSTHAFATSLLRELAVHGADQGG